jgi:Uma2 family endonuclease
MTYDEYAALRDDGRRDQFLKGELVMTPSPTRWHQEISMTLGTALREHAVRHALGTVLAAPLDVALDEHTVVQPDLLFVSTNQGAILRDANLADLPDLGVEILSPGTEWIDRLRKLDLDARFGVGHDWIVEVDARTIEEFELHGDVHRVRSVTPCEGIFRPTLFPGIEFRLSAVGPPG